MEFMPDEAFEIGVMGCAGAAFRGMREVVPFMKERGGSIINYCSMYGLVSPDLRIYGDNPQKQPPNYGAGKAAVDQLTRYAAGALAEYGIRVNAVTPGPFPNPNNQNDADSMQSWQVRPCWAALVRAMRWPVLFCCWHPMQLPS